MQIVLYTTHCPKCKILSSKLASKGIQYDVVDDVEVMINKGIMSMPVLEVDGKTLDFGEAVRWVNEME